MIRPDDAKLFQIVWNYMVRHDELPAHADVIIAGGCKDIAVAERAAGLYLAGKAPLIIMTGYKDPQYNLAVSEAEFFATRARELDVPHEAIIMEDRASNTGQNITFSAALLDRPTTVILVHKPYMTRRFLATAEAQWPLPQPQFYVTSEKTTMEQYFARRGDTEAAAVLGDFLRMRTYAERGFQSHQAIPADVQAAYDELLRRGFQTRGS